MSIREMANRMSVGQSWFVRSKNRLAAELENNMGLPKEVHEIRKA